MEKKKVSMMVHAYKLDTEMNQNEMAKEIGIWPWQLSRVVNMKGSKIITALVYYYLKSKGYGESN